MTNPQYLYETLNPPSLEETDAGVLSELHTLRKTIESISQRYFDGQQPLFPNMSQGFDQLAGLLEKTVGTYYDSLT